MWSAANKPKMLRFCLLFMFAVGTFAMQPKLPLGLSDFAHVVTQNFTFIDKTELIKEIVNDNSQVILITRPRLFGKSLGLSMLRYFFENRVSNPDILSRDIFSGLKISDHKEICAAHRGKYPVIHMSFKNIVENDYKSAEMKVFGVIGDVYERNDFLLAEDFLTFTEKQKFVLIKNRTAPVEFVKTAIFSLTKYLNQSAGTRVILLIDEFEKLFQTAFFNQYFAEMQALISDILLPCLKDNPHLHKAVMTGISVIGHDSVIEKLSNLKIYSVLKAENYANYFGFTTNDVNYLLAKFFLSEKKGEVDEMYYGYTFSGVDIYNPWSILDYLTLGGKAGYPWVKTGGTETVIKLVNALGLDVKAGFQWLLKNETITKRIYNQISYPKLVTEEESFWTLLVHTGYLSAVPKDKAVEGSYFSMRIPNKEIRDELIALNQSMHQGFKSHFKYGAQTSLAPPQVPKQNSSS